MAIKRRELLKSTLAGVGIIGAMHGRDGVSFGKDEKDLYDPWELVPLGESGIKVSRVGFGTGMKGHMRQSNQTRLGKKNFEKLLREAWDRGVRLFDMADLYGTHRFLPSAMKGIPREQYVVCTKVWFHPRGLPEKERPDSDVVVKRFLKELKTDYIDLLLIHCCKEANWPDRMKKQMDIISGLKEKETVRACGVSCHSLDALKAAVKSKWVDSIHARINAFGASMDDKPEKIIPVLKEARSAGKGLIGMKLVGEGRFRRDGDKRDTSIRTALLDAGVSAMVVGFEKVSEIDDFARRVRKVSKIGE